MKNPFKDQEISAWFYYNQYVPINETHGVNKRYEEHLINVWLVLLQNYPDAVVVDLGSNIGPFSLASRKMGNTVVSVDPNPENHVLLYNSLVLNNLDNDYVQIMNAISDGYYTYQGANSVGMLMTNATKTGQEGYVNYGASPIPYNNKKQIDYTVTSITLFDIFDIVPDRETFIIKIDIQGFECMVFEKFLGLEKKPKFLPYLMIETAFGCPSPNNASPCVATYKTKFLPLLEKSGYIPHVPWPVSYQELKDICYFDVLFVHKDAKGFPYWDQHLSHRSFMLNSELV